MERVDLCARLSRFLSVECDAAGATTPSDRDDSQLRAVLEDAAALYDGDSDATRQQLPRLMSASIVSVAAVDDMVLLALHRLLLTRVRISGFGTQERAFAALASVLTRCRDRLQSGRVVELLQGVVLFLPAPAVDAPMPGNERATTPSASLGGQPEELRLLVLSTLETLLGGDAVASAALTLLTQAPENVHFLAYVVSSLLQIAQVDRCRPAALLAIKVLQQLVRGVSTVHVLREFFPGVSVGMWRTMNAPQQASTVVVAAIECLSTMFSLCLVEEASHRKPSYSLDHLRFLQQQQKLQQKQGSTTMTTRAITPSDKVDGTAAHATFYEQAAENVDTLLSRLLTSRIEQRSWKVSLALVQLCSVVVINCRATLADSFFTCFEELMVLQTHAINTVADAARDVLRHLQAQLDVHEWLAFEPRFAERFHMQLSTLAIRCATEHESVNVRLMEVLTGYLQFQGRRFRSVLDEAIESTFTALCLVLRLDSLDTDLLRHETIATHAGVPVLASFQRRFRHFHDETSVAAAVRLLRNVGAVATPAMIVDTAFAMLADDATQAQTPEVLVILNECLKSHLTSSPAAPSMEQLDTSAHVHLVGRILDDVLALPQWQRVSSGKHSANKHNASDAVATALLIDCIGVCAELVGAEFNGFLLYVLYPLVEKLGSPAPEVERAALTALRRIAFVCGFGGELHALCEANMDYFVDALCARLEQLDEYPQTPQVVEALLRHTTIASLPLVNEITRALLRCVDLYQNGAQTTVLLRSLQLLLASFAQASAHPESTTPTTNELDDEVNSAKPSEWSELTRFLQEVAAWSDPLGDGHGKEDPPVVRDATVLSKKAAMAAKIKGAMPIEYGETSAMDGNIATADDDVEEDDGETKEPALGFETQVVEILERSSYFMADSDPIVCCLVLATVEQGVEYLRPRHKVLLPLVHRMWPSLLHRLTVTNRPILTATMRVLRTLAQCAGDFIGDRFAETVWPSMRALLASVDEPLAHVNTLKPTLTRSMLLLSLQDPPIGDIPGDVDEDRAPVTTTIRELQPRETTAHSVADTGRKTLEMQLLEATLRCLTEICMQAPSVASLVPDIAKSCTRFLSAAFPESVVDQTTSLFDAAAELNADEVFVAMAMLSQWQPPPAPSARFVTYSAQAVPSPHVSRCASDRECDLRCRKNAERVLVRLNQRSRFVRVR